MSHWSDPSLAESWRRSAEARNAMLAAATERMFARAGVRPGARVLDLGTGTGDTGLLLASRVGAQGSVVATDVAEPMVEAAGQLFREAKLSNITVHRMNAEAIDLPPRSFDAVVARNALMFLSDLAAALSGVVRVLRPGGGFAAVVWAPLAENPFNAFLIDSVRAAGRMPAPPPEVVVAFSMTDAAALKGHFEQAGFVDVEVERVAAVRSFATAADAVAFARENPVYQHLLSGLDPSAREDLLRRAEVEYRAYERDGRCAFPSVSLVASGRAPAP